MFHTIFCSQARSSYLSLFLLSFSFTLWSAESAKPTIDIIFIIITLCIFSMEVSCWSLCKRLLRVSRTLLNILAVLNDIMVCIVSVYPLISISSSLFFKPFRTVPRARTTICITVSFIFHCFVQPSNKIQVFVNLFALLLSLLFTPLEFFISALADSFSLEFE